MFHIILLEPEIPPNTGNIIRLSANTGCSLHLVRPLGFAWDDRRLKRAGLDYHKWASVRLHDNLAACLETLPGARVFALSTHNSTRHDRVAFQSGDAFLFGPETRGLPADVLASLPPGRRLRIPMQAGSRSLNLANSVAVVIYEAWRQLEFPGGQ